MARDVWTYGDPLVLELELDARELLGWLDEDVERQVRFATALGLTWTARDARDKLRDDLPKRFVIRTGWLAKGIRFKKATKATLEAEVGSVDSFMRLQEEGGYKESIEGERIGIPIAARRNRRAVTRRSRWPGRVAASARAYVEEGAKGQAALYQRIGRGTSEKLRLMWILTKRVRISPRWRMRQTVERVVAERWPINAKAALERAIKSAKPRR